MALLRNASRLLLAGVFANDGLDAALHPDEHLYEFQVAQQTWERWGIPPLPPADQRAWVRGAGIATTVLALGLATGKMPRTCALALAALSVPIALVRYPPGQAHTGKPLARRLAITGWLLTHATVGEGLPQLRCPSEYTE